MTEQNRQSPVGEEQTAAFDSRHNFGQIFRYRLSENASLIVVTALLLLIVDSLMLYFSAQGMEYLNAYERSTLLGTFAAAPINLIVVLLLVMRMFGFLHEPDASYFFFGLPVPRATSFKALTCTAVFSIVLINIPHMLISWALILYKEGWGEELQLRMMADGKLFILLLAVLAFTMLITMLTRSRFDALAYTTLFTIVWPIMITVVTFTISSFLPGFTLKSAYFLGSSRIGAVPYSMLLVPTLHIFVYYFLETGAIAYWLIFSAVTFLIAFVLYSGRKAEFANTNFGYTAPYMVMRLISAFAVGLVFGWAFYLANGMSSTLTFLLGTILGGVISHIILDMIFYRINHRWRSTFKGGFLTLLISAVFFFVLRSGALGYALKTYEDAPLTHVDLYEESIWSSTQLPVRVKSPEVMRILQDTQKQYAEAVRKSVQDNTLPEAYSPAFTSAVEHALSDIEALHTQSFYNVTIIQYDAAGSSFHRKFSWEYPDHDPAFSAVQQDQALLFWLIHKSNVMRIEYESAEESLPEDFAITGLRYDQLVNAYQRDLNDLTVEERVQLGMETPLGLMTFRSEPGYEPQGASETHSSRSRWDRNGFYAVRNMDGSGSPDSPEVLTAEDVSRMAQEDYHYEAYFEAPVSERTPRTLRLLNRYIN